VRNLVLVAAVVLLGSSSAHADRKAIEKVVKTNLAGLAKLADDDALAITRDAIVIDEHGEQVDLSEHDGCVSGAVSNAVYGCVQAEIKHVPGAITSGFAGDVGWFQAPYTQIQTDEDYVGNPTVYKSAHRIGGVAVKVGKGWKIAAALYVAPMTDKELLASGNATVPEGDPPLTGDAKLAGVVAGWFETGFAPAAARTGATGTLIASGTSAAEYKQGAAATKLAQSWDKLKLVAVSVDAKVLAGGKIGWVTADVRLPRRGGKGAVAMKLVAIVVPDGDGWRWVSLMYQGPWSVG
jgi:hypothetical protein